MLTKYYFNLKKESNLIRKYIESVFINRSFTSRFCVITKGQSNAIKSGKLIENLRAINITDKLLTNLDIMSLYTNVLVS